VTDNLSDPAPASPGQPSGRLGKPLVIASILRLDGNTGVETHVRQLLEYLAGSDTAVTMLTPYSWGRALTYPVFGLRLVLRRLSNSASVAWYRHWHEVFLRQALRRHLATAGDCVVYAQGPLEARAALRARRGPNQRVVMAVHFKTSQADEWVNTRNSPIKRGGIVYRGIRHFERVTIPRTDGILCVSEWARQALLGWLPEAASVPSAVIFNFTAQLDPAPDPGPIADIVSVGSLDSAKNHTFLLDVLAEAKRAGRIFTLDVYGRGPLGPELEKKTRSLGLEKQVRWRGFRSDSRDFLPGYRVYAHASNSETSSLAIIEAMAAGLPILAGAIGGVAELYDDGVEGRFWPLDDPARAAAMLTALLESEPEHSAAATAARKRFENKFDSAVVIPRVLDFLQGEEPGQSAAAEPVPSFNRNR
jgi:glycosyltransferase involved in cell wall biosynthesis